MIELSDRQKQLQERLRVSPDVVMLDIHGENVPFLLTDLAAEWAEKGHGIDPVASLSRLLRRLLKVAGPVFSQIRGSEGTGVLLSTLVSSLPEVLDQESLFDFGNVVFWGMLFFDPTLTRGDVVITRRVIVGNAEKLFEAATGWGADEPTAAAGDEDEGPEKNA